MLIKPVKNHKSGFSIVELSIALIIIGVILGIAFTGFSTYRSAATYKQLANNTEKAYNWVDDFIATQRRLPTQAEFAAQKFTSPNDNITYTINPAINNFTYAEQYCKTDTANKIRLFPLDTANTSEVIYSYYIDTTLKTDKSKKTNRMVGSYAGTLSLLNCRAAVAAPFVATKELPPLVRGQSYNAKIVFAGGSIGTGKDITSPNLQACTGVHSSKSADAAAVATFLGTGFLNMGSSLNTAAPDSCYTNIGLANTLTISTGLKPFTHNITNDEGGVTFVIFVRDTSNKAKVSTKSIFVPVI